MMSPTINNFRFWLKYSADVDLMGLKMKYLVESYYEIFQIVYI